MLYFMELPFLWWFILLFVNLLLTHTSKTKKTSKYTIWLPVSITNVMETRKWNGSLSESQMVERPVSIQSGYQSVSQMSWRPESRMVLVRITNGRETSKYTVVSNQYHKCHGNHKVYWFLVSITNVMETRK